MIAKNGRIYHSDQLPLIKCIYGRSNCGTNLLGTELTHWIYIYDQESGLKAPSSKPVTADEPGDVHGPGFGSRYVLSIRK